MSDGQTYLNEQREAFPGEPWRYVPTAVYGYAVDQTTLTGVELRWFISDLQRHQAQMLSWPGTPYTDEQHREVAQAIAAAKAALLVVGTRELQAECA